jgi:hypothetical protein
MANEPPCWILDKHYKDTGKRNYSNCNPSVCTVLCEEGEDVKRTMYYPYFLAWRPQIVTDRKHLLLLLKDVDVQKAIKAIVSEKPKKGG